jgi:uncharacterized protein (DUF1330 family)
MAAYVLFAREKMMDPKEMESYMEKAPASFVGHPVQVLATHTHFEVIEGPPVESVVLLKFPSLAEAKAWYQGPGYAEALAHRLKGAVYRCLMFEGKD